MIKQWLTIFREDDVTTVDGVVAADPPTPAQATCSTDLAHARPALFFEEQGIERGINLAEGVVSIGAGQIRVQDNRRLASQDTGWFTWLLGQQELRGCRVILTQQDQWAGPYVVWDQIITDVEIEDEYTSFKLSTRDAREREREHPLFSRADSTIIWPLGENIGQSTVGPTPLNGYGRLNPSDPASPLLIKPGKGAHGTYLHNTAFPAAPQGFIKFDQEGSVSGPTLEFAQDEWFKVFAQYNVYSGAFDWSVAAGALVGAKLTGMYVMWRPWGSSGAWTTLRDMEAHRLISFPQYRNGLGFQVNRTNWRNDNDFHIYTEGVGISGPDLASLPADGQSIEFKIISGVPPTSYAPFYFEGTLGQFLLNYFQGLYTVDNPQIRYDAAYMADLAANSEWIRIIKDKMEDQGQDWINEHIYKTYGYLPLLNDKGEVHPVKTKVPDPSVPLLLLDKNNVEAKTGWRIGSNDAINKVTFQYWRDYVDAAKKFQSIEVHVDDLNAPGIVMVGEKSLDFTPDTVRDVTDQKDGGTGRNAAMGDTGFQVARQRQFEMIDRLAMGGQHISVVALRTDPAVRAAKEGDWAEVYIPWLPNIDTGLRGIVVLAQIMGINDQNPVGRQMRLLTAAPHDNPLAVPVHGGQVVTADFHLDVPVTSMPAGSDAEMEYAIAPALPAANSSAWMFGERKTGPGPLHLYSRILPDGGTVWNRIRSIQLGKRPSPWVYGASVPGPVRPAAINPYLLQQLDGSTLVVWQNGPGTLGARISYGIYAPGIEPDAILPNTVDVDSTLEQYVLPAIRQHETIAVEIQGFTGFAAGAVSGTGGTVSSRLTVSRVDLAAQYPVVAEDRSGTTSTVGQLTLTITDPQLRLTRTRFQTQIGNGGTPGAWVDDLVAPYGTSVTILPNDTSYINYEVYATDVNGVETLVAKATIPFTASSVVSTPILLECRVKLTASTDTTCTYNVESLASDGTRGNVTLIALTNATISSGPAVGAVTADGGSGVNWVFNRPTGSIVGNANWRATKTGLVSDDNPELVPGVDVDSIPLILRVRPGGQDNVSSWFYVRVENPVGGGVISATITMESSGTPAITSPIGVGPTSGSWAQNTGTEQLVTVTRGAYGTGQAHVSFVATSAGRLAANDSVDVPSKDAVASMGCRLEFVGLSGTVNEFVTYTLRIIDGNPRAVGFYEIYSFEDFLEGPGAAGAVSSPADGTNPTGVVTTSYDTSTAVATIIITRSSGAANRTRYTISVRSSDGLRVEASASVEWNGYGL